MDRFPGARQNRPFEDYFFVGSKSNCSLTQPVSRKGNCDAKGDSIPFLVRNERAASECRPGSESIDKKLDVSPKAGAARFALTKRVIV